MHIVYIKNRYVDHLTYQLINLSTYQPIKKKEEKRQCIIVYFALNAVARLRAHVRTRVLI